MITIDKLELIFIFCVLQEHKELIFKPQEVDIDAKKGEDVV
jgi:hypothetical protein